MRRKAAAAGEEGVLHHHRLLFDVQGGEIAPAGQVVGEASPRRLLEVQQRRQPRLVPFGVEHVVDEQVAVNQTQRQRDVRAALRKVLDEEGANVFTTEMLTAASWLS